MREQTSYEKRQQFNAVVKWLHTFRYQHITQVFTEVAAKIGDRQIKVIDVGCAHAKLFDVLDPLFRIDYTGIEVTEEIVEVARSRHADRPNFRIICGRAENELVHLQGADVIVSLETLEHIPERDVVRIVEAIAAAKPGLFVASVPVEIGPAIWAKNIGSLIAGYGRHREYTWAETWWAGLGNLERVGLHTTGHKGFDWRWLAQTVRHNMRIREIRKFPFSFMPASTSSSVFFVAECRPA